MNRLNPYLEVRRDQDKALRQLEIEEQMRAETSEREARRMMYRPRYFKVPLWLKNLIIFTMTMGLVFLCMWLAFAL